MDADEVTELARERSVDVLILEEFGGTPVAFLEQLNCEGHARFAFEPLRASPSTQFHPSRACRELRGTFAPGRPSPFDTL
jgi:hypothetical protein